MLGQLYPRERLVEDDLMARFDAKRHVVRSALRELESRGVVERRANVGAFVRTYTVAEVRNLYDVRELLEVHCAHSIPLPPNEEQLAELIAIQQRHDLAIERSDFRGVVRNNIEFHQTLYGLAENGVLVEAIRRHAQMAYPIRSVTVTSPEHVLLARDEHWLMIDALHQGDASSLAEICARHLRPSRDAYLQRLEAADDS